MFGILHIHLTMIKCVQLLMHKWVHMSIVYENDYFLALNILWKIFILKLTPK